MTDTSRAPFVPFIGAKLKVLRADRHIKELEATLESVLHSDFCSLVADRDSDSGQPLPKLVTKGPMPAAIPLMIGDVIHNLRTSLDYFWNEIIRATTGEERRETFPFHEELANLKDRVFKSPLGAVADDIANLIIEDIKPYKAGNFPLWALTKLDNIDKHRLLIPVFGISSVYNIRGIDDNDNVVFIREVSARQGGDFNIVRFAADFKFDADPKASFTVLFDEGQVFGHKQLVPNLRALSNNVSGVIHAFEALGCIAEPSP